MWFETEKLSPQKFFLLVFVAGLLLRFVALGAWSFWTDEIYTVRVAERALLTTEGIPSDQHPPLYYLLLQGWLTFGRSEFWVRLPSAIAGTLAILFFYLAGKEVKQPYFGVVAGTLLAFSSLHVWYSREARMYGPATLFWAISLYFFLRTLWRKEHYSWLFLAFANIASFYTAYPSLALIIMQVAFFLPLYLTRNVSHINAGKWVLAQLLFLLGIFYWLPFMEVQFGRGTTFNWSIPLISENLRVSLSDTLWYGAILGLVGILLFTGLMVVVIKVKRLQTFLRKFSPLLAWGIVVAYLMLVIAGTISRGLSIRRQLLVFLPPFLLLATWAFLHIKRKKLFAFVTVFAFIANIIMLLQPAYEDWRGTAQYFTDNEVPADIVLVSPGWNASTLNYYMTNMETISSRRYAKELSELKSGDSFILIVNDHPGLVQQNDQIQAEILKTASFERVLYTAPKFITLEKYLIK